MKTARMDTKCRISRPPNLNRESVNKADTSSLPPTAAPIDSIPAKDGPDAKSLRTEMNLFNDWIPQRATASLSELLSRLTVKQREVLKQFVRLHSDKRVAGTMGLKVSTVTNHMRGIEKRLKVESRVQLVCQILTTILSTIATNKENR